MKRAFSTVSLHLAEDARIRCFTYPAESDDAPILAVDLPAFSLSLTSRGPGVEPGDIDTAWRLLEAVTRYTAEIERLYALRGASPDRARDSAA
ncbi:hypothetical protein [Actinomadura litoris]|uniref:hypothetical protein n=1 Tax=Actinomadura litoris TaxID=2678616 RepID=UPI001FA8027C|nr:hypothetical protein [Actinomadura litoris]